MANPYQGDDTDYFSAVRDEKGNVKQTGLPKSATPKKKDRVVTKEELKKSGFTNLRDFLNAERGLKRRDGKKPDTQNDMSDKDRLRAQLDSAKESSQAGRYGTMKKGGMVSSASKRADGIAKKGKTRGRMV